MKRMLYLPGLRFRGHSMRVRCPWAGAVVAVLCCVAFSMSAAQADDAATVPAPTGPEGESAAETPAAVPLSPEEEREARNQALLREAEELAADLQRLEDEVDELRQKQEGATGEELLIIEGQITQRRVKWIRKVAKIVDNLLERERLGFETEGQRALLEAGAARILPEALQMVERAHRRLLEESSERDQVPLEDRVIYEESVGNKMLAFDQLLSDVLDFLDEVDRLGVDASAQREEYVYLIDTRAERLAGRLHIARTQLDDIARRLEDAPGDSGLQTHQRAVQAKRDAVVASLTNTTRLMKRLGMDSAEYSKLLITTTGEITSDILDFAVVRGLVEQGVEQIREGVLLNGPLFAVRTLLFLLILVFFKGLAVIVRRLVARAMDNAKSTVSQLAKDMIISLTSRGVMILGILFALSQVGVEMGPLLAGIGVAGFIVGFALQDSLANFAAGTMILFYRPFDVGDLIDVAGGVFGRVSHMNLVSTTIYTIDNQTIVVPNNKIWGDVIKNVTDQELRRVDLKFRASYEDDADRVEAVFSSILEDHPKVLSDPEPMVKLHELGESAMVFVVRPWVERADYWDVYWDVTREVKRRFDREGLIVPYPHLRTYSGPSRKSGD